MSAIIPSQRIERHILLLLTWEEVERLRSQFVILDVGPKGPLRSQSVTLDGSDAERSRSQSVILKRGTSVKYLPYAFTEQGVAMLSSVLRSRRAVQVNIAIMRAFVHLRELLATHKDLARKLQELESKHDKQFAVIFDAIRQLMAPPPAPEQPKTPIGFRIGEAEAPYRRRPLRRAAGSARRG